MSRSATRRGPDGGGWATFTVLRERMGTVVTEHRNVLVAVVRAEQERGAIPATTSAEGVATLATAVGDGLFLHALLDPDLDVSEALGASRVLLAPS